MARYHFNVYNGVVNLDHAGTDLADWQEARLEAIRCAGAILKDEPKRLALGEDWRMEVTDEQGLVLFRLDFSVVDAPVLFGRHPPK